MVLSPSSWTETRAGAGPAATAAPGAASWVVAAAWVGLAAASCQIDQTPRASIPPAEAYDAPSNFGGEWLGEVDGEVGTLRIDGLGPGRYRGLYRGETMPVEYVLKLEQSEVTVGEQQLSGNRAIFEWQDGRGSRGTGWLLVNREDTALTGMFGERGELDRTWTFIRVE